MKSCRFAFCFSHGVLHDFPVDDEPWCTATWVPFVAATKEQALEAKQAAYGDARFFDQLPVAQQLEVIEIRQTWDVPN